MSADGKRRRTCWCIDLENTGSRWSLAAHLFQPDDLVAMFWSSKSCTPDLKAMSALPGLEYTFLECRNGTPNAMDFQLVAWLGRMSALNPDMDFVILSGDRGYAPVPDFLKKFGTEICLIGPDDIETDIAKQNYAQTTTRTALQNEHSLGPMPVAKQLPRPQEIICETYAPKPADPQDEIIPYDAPRQNEANSAPKPSLDNAYQNPVRAAYIAKLQDAGVSDPDDLRILSAILMQSMLKPQNMRKLDTYNRLTGKYGAKEGTLRYNAVKPVVHDIATNGPYPENTAKKPKPNANDINMALSKAGITLKTGQVTNSLTALKAALEYGDVAKASQHLYNAVQRIFSKTQRDLAFNALYPFLGQKS